LSRTYDAIVVGAGIVGTACAWELARSGMRVLVVDRGPAGGGATAAGMGHLVVMDDSEAQFALTFYSRRLWHELGDALPADVEFQRCGTLWIAADEDEMAEVARKAAFARQRGVRVEALDSRAVAEAEPNLRPGMAGALRVPDDVVIYPPCAARYFLERARSHGAESMLNTPVRALRPEGGVVLADGTAIEARFGVNAGGSWSPELTPGLPVRPRKGHLIITDRYPGFARHQLVELGYLKSAHSVASDSVAFNLQPRKTGQMLLGSSRQFDALDDRVEMGMLDRMIRRAQEYVPGIADLNIIRCWTGHRAATPDKLPLIGPSLTSERIWQATGHEGLGITTCLGTARLLADTMLGRATQIDHEPYLPGRFAAGAAHDG
jgi:glycine/D-amino acid oxidase-like deaminating enzyme